MSRKGRCNGFLILSIVAIVVSASAWSVTQESPFTWEVEPVVKIRALSEESRHVEYPTVYKLADSTAMLYSAYGDDRRWRIKLALSKGGNEFVGQGNIFDESKLSFQGGYAFPFVRVVGEGRPTFELYFSVVDGKSQGYTAIYRSFSVDGINWGSPEKLISDAALDPVVFKKNGHDIILYSRLKSGQNQIVSAMLDAAGGVTSSRVVYSPRSGIYTLGVLHVRGTPILIVETEKGWRPLCFNAAGNLVAVSKAEIFKFPTNGEKRWDALRYGMYFLEDSTNPLMYYNGVEARGSEQGGQIGVGRYDVSRMARLINSSKCQ